MRSRFIFFLVIAWLTVSADTVFAKSRPSLHVQGGTNIERYGFAIDASYDPRLDGLIPGYHIVNVAIVNNSLNILFLNPEKDRWSIRTGKGKGKSRDAIIDLRRADPAAWGNLSERVQRLMAYPLALPIGARLAIDLLVPASVNVGQLTEVIASFDSLSQTFVIAVRE